MMNIAISKINSIVTIAYLQNHSEDQYFERKGLGIELIKPTKIAEELIGMLNADGGIIAFGISDDGEIQDLNTLDNLDNYRKLIFDFISPPCNVKLEEITINNRLIFLYHVEQELERTFYHSDTNSYFLRIADSNRKLNLEQIKKLEYDKNIRQFEDEIVTDFDIDDLDNTLLNAYKMKLNFQDEVMDLLYSRHLVTKKEGVYFFKKAAVLLFSQSPEKYIPNASVRYIRYQGVGEKTGESHNVVKDERFESNILNLITQLQEFLRISLKDFYFLDIELGRFLKVSEYPEAAWLEGIVNALCHRSYNRQGSSVYIRHFDNRLEISNSGPLPAQVTIDNIKTERFARNPRIARVLEDFGYVRQLNEGVKRIYETMESSMLSEPEYEVKNSNVYLTLRNNIRSHSKTVHTQLMRQIERDWQTFNETQQSMLLYLFTKGEAKLSDIAKHININVNSVRSYINDFVEAGILQRNSLKKRDVNALYTFAEQ